VRREGREGGEGRGERGEGGESNGWWWQARCVAVALTGSSFGLPRTLPFASNPPKPPPHGQVEVQCEGGRTMWYLWVFGQSLTAGSHREKDRQHHQNRILHGGEGQQLSCSTCGACSTQVTAGMTLHCSYHQVAITSSLPTGSTFDTCHIGGGASLYGVCWGREGGV